MTVGAIGTGRPVGEVVEGHHATHAPWATWDWGAAASNWFMAPHSSASTWPNVTQRSWSMGTTEPMASAGHREMPPGAGVEDRRLVVVDEVLVEREPGRPDVGHVGGDPVDAVGDFVDAASWDCLLRGGGDG